MGSDWLSVRANIAVSTQQITKLVYGQAVLKFGFFTNLDWSSTKDQARLLLAVTYLQAVNHLHKVSGFMCDWLQIVVEGYQPECGPASRQPSRPLGTYIIIITAGLIMGCLSG